MEKQPKHEQGDLVKFLGRTFTYLGEVEPFVALTLNEEGEDLLVYCNPEDVYGTES